MHFGDVLEERIIFPLALMDTSPNNHAENYGRVLSRLAKPYEVDEDGNFLPGSYPTSFRTSAGLVSSVADLAAYDMALRRSTFVRPETQELAFTPTVTTMGETVPYGLGWYTRRWMGLHLVWHTGTWVCNSSLYLKLPSRDLTFVVLTNTNALSRGFNLGYGDVLDSPVAIAFLRAFVLGDYFGEEIPAVDWEDDEDAITGQLMEVTSTRVAAFLERELMTEWSISNLHGEETMAGRLLRIHERVFVTDAGCDTTGLYPLVRIDRVGSGQAHAREFRIDAPTPVSIYAIGEIAPGQAYDYGWIEDAVSGEVVWQMTGENTRPAGGLASNRRACQTLQLPAGSYRLHFVSDEGHAWGNWMGFPPDDRNWGIMLLTENPNPLSNPRAGHKK
jgi:hypothetical protein